MNNTSWDDLSEEQTYKLSMAEFKGATIQALKEIKNNIDCNKDEIAKIRDQLNNVKFISGLIGGIGGAIATFGYWLLGDKA